tara:strand:- start:193 stop:888 length:696 start_codon:yes stop_codon:yes gene_type:complete
MRARHRHFNARDAGAVFVVDSRYITGLSDGNAVSTWNDRSRNSNNATQATASWQPTYQTAEQGGQPLVKFDGSDDRMATAAVVTTVTDNWTLFSVAKTISGSRVHFSNGSDNGYAQTHKGGGSPSVYGGLYGGVQWMAADSSFTARLDEWIIMSMRRESGTLRFWGNGIIGSISILANPNIASGFTWLGADNGGRQNCEISTAAVINVSISESLKKRLEHAAAYSFKIACS